MTLEELYDLYETALQRYAYSLTHDYDRAADLVQDACIRSMGHLQLLGTLRPGQQRAWLKQTVKNLFLDEERRRQRQTRIFQQMEIAESVGEEEVFATILTPNPLENVPDDVRELFEMRYGLGMNSTEIGETLGIPAATVRSRLNYNLQKLRQYRSNWE